MSWVLLMTLFRSPLRAFVKHMWLVNLLCLSLKTFTCLETVDHPVEPMALVSTQFTDIKKEVLECDTVYHHKGFLDQGSHCISKLRSLIVTPCFTALNKNSNKKRQYNVIWAEAIARITLYIHECESEGASRKHNLILPYAG